MKPSPHLIPEHQSNANRYANYCKNSSNNTLKPQFTDIMSLLIKIALVSACRMMCKPKPFLSLRWKQVAYN